MQIERMVQEAAGLRLRTARLLLRVFAERDRETAMAHELDPRIMRHIRDPLPEDALQARLDTFHRDWTGADGEWLGLVVADAATDAMLGIVAFRIECRDRETVEIGYRLHPDHQGKGLAGEAVTALLDWLFVTCGARKAVAFCVAENERSFRLMERLGMQREARLREYSRLGGAWRDEFVYGLLAREWTNGGGGSRSPA